MSTEDELDKILTKARWGDYQNNDGTWRYGVTNRPELIAALEALITTHNKQLINRLRAAIPEKNLPDDGFGKDDCFNRGHNTAIDQILKALADEEGKLK